MMNIVKKILFTIILLTMLLVGFLLVCHFNPNITKTIAGFLYGDDSGDNGGKKGLIRPKKDNKNEILGLEDFDITPDESYPFVVDYIIPDVSTMFVPEAVAGKVGYEEPLATVKELDDTAADEIVNTLGPGATGDNLDFDALMYPYYHMLDDKGKHLYRQVVANSDELNDAFSPVEECEMGDIKKVMTAVFNDHPELFWLNTAYNCKSRGQKEIVELDLSFNRTADDINSSKSDFENCAENILYGARGLANDFEKEKYVHDALANNITYSLSAPMNQSAYSALVNNKTVCAGYARAMQYLMQRLGVPCYYCQGYAGENHAWNIIRLDDDFYNVDVTWDDADPTNYEYFNKDDSNYASTHARKNLSINLPACNGKNYQVESTMDMEERAGEDEYYDEPEDGWDDESGESGPVDYSEYDSDVPDMDMPEGSEPSYEEGLDIPVNGQNNLIADAVDNDVPANRRSLADTGISEGEVLNTIDDYFAACRKQIADRGKGNYNFVNVINGDELYRQWEEAYNTNTYKDAYLREAMASIGAKGCQLSLSVEPLTDGKYLITHSLNFD